MHQWKLFEADTPYHRVYQALDAALHGSDRALAPGTEAAVQAALHEIRTTGGPAEAVAALQSISVDLARLVSALRSNDAEQLLAQRTRIAAIKDDWLKLAPLE